MTVAITIDATAKEIAAFVLAVQGRPSEALMNEVVEELTKGPQNAADGTSPS